MQASAPIQPDIYFQSKTYFHAIDKLEAIVRAFDPAAPDMVRSDLIQVLGEELGIWPEECLKAQETTTARLVA